MRTELPWFEILEWPDRPVTASPLTLARLSTDREEQLRRMLPSPAATSWATAGNLLHWVSHQWEHANTDTEIDDAVQILEAVARGQRFQCDQYAVVLAQALNAQGIPARLVGLRLDDYDHGVGKARSAVDAWIDDLGKWVLLDAQNAAYWAYDTDPLGPVELQTALHRGDPRPVMVGCESEADFWWPYMYTVSVVGGAAGDFRWSSTSFCPIFQDRFLLQTVRLLRTPETLYPNLGAVWVGIIGTRSEPELTLSTSHPYAVAFGVDGDHVEHSWLLDLSPGEHQPAITLITSYGEMAAGRLRYRVNA